MNAKLRWHSDTGYGLLTRFQVHFYFVNLKFTHSHEPNQTASSPADILIKDLSSHKSTELEIKNNQWCEDQNLVGTTHTRL